MSDSKTDHTSLSHLNAKGEARMVDISDKADSTRVATAESRLVMQAGTLALIMQGGMPKGDVIATARIAGIMAAKKCSDLIPMCHPLPVTGVDMTFTPTSDTDLTLTATVKTTGKTGVEMEALTAVSVAALTVYDMAKAVDKAIVITDTRLLAKSGGKSGDYRAD